MIQRWDWTTHSYNLTTVPSYWNVKLMSDDMNELVNCANCGLLFPYGEAYTSMEFHNAVGLGFPVCYHCYELEGHRQALSQRGTVS